MKKLTLIFCFTILLSLFSCNIKPDDTIDSDEFEKYSTIIYEVDTEVYQNEPEFNHKNTISEEVVYSIDSTVKETISVTICNNVEKLEYQDTMFYPVASKRVHRYYVDGKEDEIVLIDEDGAINSIYYTFATLDISKTATPDTVRPLLEEKISTLIDISYYSEVSVDGGNNESPDGFGRYYFLYYNSVNGYMTDYMKVNVKSDGSVYVFSINNVPKKDFEINIDSELEKTMINLKFKDIYTTEKTKYISYNTQFSPYVVVYENELYVCYSAAAKYEHETKGEISSWLNRILIPLDLITAK